MKAKRRKPSRCKSPPAMPSNVATLKRQARNYLQRLHPEQDSSLLSEAIAEGIASVLAKYPGDKWKQLPAERLFKIIIGSASNWLRRNQCLISLRAVLPPPSSEAEDTSMLEDSLFPDWTHRPDDIVMSRVDILWLLQHFSTEEQVIILARWLDFEYSEIVSLIHKRQPTDKDIVTLRQQYHRLRERMLKYIHEGGYLLNDPRHRRIGIKRTVRITIADPSTPQQEEHQP